MPRTQTPAAERTRQNHRLVERISAELGRPVTVDEAIGYQRAKKLGARFPGHLVSRDIDFSDQQIRYLGQLITQVEDFKLVRGVVASLSLTTVPEYRHLLLDAAAISRHSVLMAVLYEIPRDLGLDDEEMEGDGGN